MRYLLATRRAKLSALDQGLCLACAFGEAECYHNFMYHIQHAEDRVEVRFLHLDPEHRKAHGQLVALERLTHPILDTLSPMESMMDFDIDLRAPRCKHDAQGD